MAQTPVRVVCIGNSITEGAGLSNPSVEAYPIQLANLLGSNYSLLNCGVSGRTMLKHGDVPYWNESKYSQAKAYDPNIVIIALGTNDSKPWNWKLKSEFYSDYAAMIGEFRTNGKNPQIFVCIPPPAFIGNFGITDSVIRNEIQPLIDSLCTTFGTSKIDFFHKMITCGSYFGDGIHPNKDGAKIMAQIAYKAITEPIAITSVKSPVSGYALTENEEINININNNQDIPLTNVPVAYKIDQGPEVKEIIASLPARMETIYKFTQKANLSSSKEYSMMAYTALESGLTNDTIQVKTINANPQSDLAIYFSGDDNRVRIKHSTDLMPTTALTVEAWIYPTAFKKEIYSSTVLSKEQTGSYKGYTLSIGGNGQGRFTIFDGSIKQAIAPVGSLVLNEWQHIAGVYNGSSIILYVNGNEVSRTVAGKMQISNGDLCIGQTSYAVRDRSFIGGIDEVRIWDKALTEEEINLQKESLLWGNESGLKACFTMNDGFGSTIAREVTETGKIGKLENMEYDRCWMKGRNLVPKSGTRPTDVSMVSVKGPNPGMGLTNEDITVKVFNHSEVELSSVPVSYQIDKGVAITETIEKIASQSSVTYTFTQKANLSEFKTYQITAFSALKADLIHQNDSSQTTVTNYDYKTDFALVASGSNDGSAIIPHTSSLMPTSAFTIEAWVYPTQFRTNVWEGTVLSKESSNGGYALNIGGNGSGRIVIGSSNWYEAVIPVKTIVLNTWTHIAGVYDGTKIMIYVNGVLKATKTGVGAIKASDSPLRLGASPAFGSREFKGSIDEVRIWNRALTAGQIKTYKDFRLKGNEAGLVAYYKLNEIPGSSVVIDSTSNANNGTLSNLDVLQSWVKGVGLTAQLDLTGIESIDHPLGVSIYPNPTTDFITVKLNKDSKVTDVTLTDMMGKSVLNRRFNKNEQEIKMDVRSLLKGIYLITISSETERTTLKVSVR